jgi:hypothetical protein
MLKTGIITAPPAMVRDISDFVVGSYATRILENFEEKRFPRNKESMAIRTVLEALAERSGKKMIIHQIDFAYYFAKLNFDDWDGPVGPGEKIKEVLGEHGVVGVKCYEVFYPTMDKHPRPGANAQWSYNFQITTYAELPMAQNLQDFRQLTLDLQGKQNELKVTVAHELIHMVQYIIQIMRGLKEIGGLPAEKVRHSAPPLVDPSIPYHLRDEEFYTSLADTIETFMEHVRNVPVEYREIALRSFLNLPFAAGRDARKNLVVSTFFEKMHKDDPKRWAEYAKKFVKHLSQHPEIMGMESAAE